MSLKTEKIAVVDSISTVCNYLKKKASGTDDDVKEEWLSDEVDGSGEQPAESTATEGADRPYDRCHISLSPFGDVLAVGRVDRVVVLRGRCSSRHPTKFSVKTRRILRLTSSVTSLLCLPLGSSHSSMSGGVDWTCVAAGTEDGCVSFHTEDGRLLCTVHVLDSPVLELRCTARSGCDLGHYLYTVGHSTLTLLDVSQLCSHLQHLRSQLAKYGAVSDASSSSDVWTPRRMRVRWRQQDAPPALADHRVQSAALVGERSAKLLDHLWQLSQPAAVGPATTQSVTRVTVPSAGVIVTTGVTPFIGVCHVENIVEPVDMEQVARQVASGFLHSILQSARSSTSSFVNLSISSSMGVWDKPRAGQRVVASHNGRYCAISDSLGRISLLDCCSATVVRMWKGYRDAQCSWLCVDEPNTPSLNSNNNSSGASETWCTRRSCRQVNYLLVYLPARGLLQVWLATNGACVAVCSVAKHGVLLHIEHNLLDPEHTFWSPLSSTSSTSTRTSAASSSTPTFSRPSCTLQCAFISPSGSIYSVSVPFHLALGSDRRSHDTFTLGLLEGMLSSRGGASTTGCRLATRLITHLATLRSVSARQHALASVVNCRRLDASTLLQALDALHRDDEEKPVDPVEVKCWRELTADLARYRRLIASLTTLNSLLENTDCSDNQRKDDAQQADSVDSVVSWMQLNAPLSSTLRHILSTENCDVTSSECVDNTRVKFEQPEIVAPALFLSYLTANTANSQQDSVACYTESRSALAHLIFAGVMLSETKIPPDQQREEQVSIDNMECSDCPQDGVIIADDNLPDSSIDRIASHHTTPEDGGDSRVVDARADIDMQCDTDEGHPSHSLPSTTNTETLATETQSTTAKSECDNVSSKPNQEPTTETIAPHCDKRDAFDWLTVVRCLELPVSRLAALLAEYWLSMTGRVTTGHVTRLFSTLSVCAGLAAPSDRLVWKELVELISASQHVGRAFVMAAVCRTVVVTIEQNNQECGTDARSNDCPDVTCSDDTAMGEVCATSPSPDCDWESLSVMSIGWDLLLHQLSDVVSVCDVIKTDQSEAAVTLTRLIHSGPGCVSELLARQMISASITARDLTMLQCDEEDTDTAEPTIIDHVTTDVLTHTESRDEHERRQQLREWTAALNARFRHSVAVDNLAVNCVWELMNIWSRNPANTHLLLQALAFVEVIGSLQLRQGVCMLVWSAHFRAPLTTLFNMLNEHGRIPDDAECVKQLRMISYQLPDFTKSVVKLLDIASVATEETTEMATSEANSGSDQQLTSELQCDDLWSLTSSTPSRPGQAPRRHRRCVSLSLTEMCLQQQQQQQRHRFLSSRSETSLGRWCRIDHLWLTISHCLHWQLACVLCVTVCLRTIANTSGCVLPGQLFYCKVLSEILFEPDASDRTSFDPCTEQEMESLLDRIVRKRRQFIDEAVARATALISQSGSENKMADLGETLAWTTMLDGLCAAWSIEDYSQRQFTVALFSHGLDSLGYEVWNTISAAGLFVLEPILLNVARSRIRSLLNIQLQNSSARLESIIPSSDVFNSIKTCVFALENYCVSMQETRTLLRALTRPECQPNTVRKAEELLFCTEQLNL